MNEFMENSVVCIGRHGGCLCVGLIIILWFKNEWNQPSIILRLSTASRSKKMKKHKTEQFLYWFLKKCIHVRLFFTVELSSCVLLGRHIVVLRGSLSELNTDAHTASAVDIVLCSVYNTAPCWYPAN